MKAGSCSNVNDVVYNVQMRQVCPNISTEWTLRVIDKLFKLDDNLFLKLCNSEGIQFFGYMNELLFIFKMCIWINREILIALINVSIQS